MKALYGHTSEATAYLINDYPYGGMRCRIRFWLEHNPKKGYRFVSQTENPKTLRWNAPKKSTYVLLAAGMFLDEKEHVAWKGISEYSKPEEVKEFILLLPQGEMKLLKAWCLKKAVYSKGRAEGKIIWTIGGKPQPDSEHEKEQHRKEHEMWMECATLIGG